MSQLVDINEKKDIFPEYRKTPVGDLLEFHNLNRPLETCTGAQLLIEMCMDNRIHLQIPDNFAYIIRSGGANLRFSEFKVSYAIAIGNIKHIALIGHNKCGMVNLKSIKDRFISGLIENAGWDRIQAQEHFMNYEPVFEIENEISFVIAEAKQLRMRYPKITVATMLFNVDDNRLYLVNEE